MHAVRSNTAHGLPLSMVERKAAALQILRDYPYCSDRSLSTVVGLSAKTVAMLRRSTVDPPQSNGGRIGRDGRVRPGSAVQGRLHASRVLRANPGASLRDVARQSGISLSTAHDVKRRLRNGQDPVPTQQRGASRASCQAVPDGCLTGLGSGDAAHPTKPPSLVQLLFLRRDPALRATETGRALLRLVIAHEAALAGDGELLSGVPPHCAPAMAEVARDVARIWCQFADELSRLAPEA
ncbi:winged helix-turn-helix domain-containing protein [Streptomyces sp. RB6PN23]|uniref:Winged helix-turn-helix domain-containing protein n=1 Tax=Streptomyces silvisoli TaxID=3034235 RepID=A0ABT5ZVU8_9ACTN|nr:winged helix-turn-helix domain-containing protein [Streptomyces silvisoli]